MAINIYEEDLTNIYGESINTDVVFVPGFSSIDLNAANVLETAVKPFVPTLCSSLAQFEAAFGEVPAVFKTELKYGDTTKVKFSPIATEGFSDKAWFNKGNSDPSYIYAKELINAGISVVYMRLNQSEDDVTIDNFYTKLIEEVYTNIPEKPTLEDIANLCAIADKGQFQIKFLTTGGYPNFEVYIGDLGSESLANRMAKLATYRGDCIALIDPTDNPSRALTGNKSVIHSVQTKYDATTNEATCKLDESCAIFASMTYPWCEFKTALSYTNASFNEFSGKIFLPGSFAYLSTYAKSIKNNPNWYAVAGIVRGVVPNLISVHTDKVLNGTISEIYQTKTNTSINPITYIRDTGYCIMGNRTLAENKNGCKASSYLSNRNAVSDIKKEAYNTCNNLKFEQNTSILWVNFKESMRPLLDRMVSGQGLKDYMFIKNNKDPKTGAAIPETKLSAIIRVYPVYAVEDFDIYVQLTDDDTVEVE